MPFQPAIIDRNPSPAEAPATPGWPETAVCLILLGAAVVKLWLLPLASGFWLDETGTFWVIKGGFSGIAPRCLLWTAQSPLYSFIVWAAAKVGGMHEPVLRLPSTLASAAGAYILFQLGRKLLNARAALVAVLLFVCAEPVAFAAADARPYAIATTVALAAMLMLVRWCETQ